MRLRDLLLRLFVQVRHRCAAAWRLLAGRPRILARRAERALPRVTAGNARDSERDPSLLDFEAAALPYGDFRDPEEAARFSALPPIEPALLEEIDWDALVRELDRPD